ncbi:hypothetical protein [Bremerella cremea]|uniref:hypothetical protein n=1 Tax=Bremerella cremea TaxID=1031537 RepID=UPI0031EF6F84
MWQIAASVGSYESGAVNHATDVKTVQRMLTDIARKLNVPAFSPGGVDGVIARIASQSSTVKAITQFQVRRVGMAQADQRIDVGGKTWKAMIAVVGAAAPPPPRAIAGAITLTVQHDNKFPQKTKRQGGFAPTYGGTYESSFVLSGGVTGTFRGSIWPDDMTIKGHVIDGTYPLHIGFHQGGNKAKQTAADLVVKEQGVRPGLLVNARSSVTVKSDNPGKTISSGINVHNGFYSARFSDGCLTLHPNDWQRFMQIFIDGFPDINDWHTLGNNTGKRIGQLIVKP